jgi:hypothetical protein
MLLVLEEREMNSLFRCRSRVLGVVRQHVKWRGTGSAIALLGAAISLAWGQPAEAPKAVPPGVTPPPHPAPLIEITIPAGARVAIEGSKLTAHPAKKEVVTEGEATLRLANHILLRAHGARVTVTQPGGHKESRVTIEPMPSTVASR